MKLSSAVVELVVDERKQVDALQVGIEVAVFVQVVAIDRPRRHSRRRLVAFGYNPVAVRVADRVGLELAGPVRDIEAGQSVALTSGCRRHDVVLPVAELALSR